MPSRALLRYDRLLFAAFALLCSASLFTLISFSLWSLLPQQISDMRSLPQICANLTGIHPLDSYLRTNKHITNPGASPLDSNNFVVGSPTYSFRDNLRNDTQYITSWTGAGWTNDVMTYANLIYLAEITNRVPIIPKFTRNVVHLDGDIEPLAFGEVFDVPRLSKIMRIGILEWSEVKATDSVYFDGIGCWSVWDAVTDEDKARSSDVPGVIKLDISYTRVPSYVKLDPNNDHEIFTSFWSLATLAYPQSRAENLVTPRPSPEHGLQLAPDEHLLCYDYLYYVSALKPFEYEYDFSPGWNQVLQHMRFTNRVLKIADSHLRRELRVPLDDTTPPWISVHVRHHDFANSCGDVSIQECFAPLSVYARRVREVQEELLSRKGLDVKYVIMTSDERDPAWWADVTALGWHHINFTAQHTEEIYGPWYPIIVDAVLQSEAAGFVGTSGSTMSLIAGRRVQSWRSGITKMVKWGRPGADDH